MAKFAKVGYGSAGQGLGTTEDGYTYIVNDNVRTGDTIQPVATSRKGRKFATTGVVRHAYRENSVNGQEAKQEAQEAGADITNVYSGKELGVGGSRVARIPQGSEPKHKPASQYAERTRAGNLAMYMQQNPNAELTKNARETFDTYSKPFME